MSTTDGQIWRKSSRSSEENCVEVAFVPGAVAVRDSKNPHGPMLSFPPSAFDGFVTAARHGRLG